MAWLMLWSRVERLQSKSAHSAGGMTFESFGLASHPCLSALWSRCLLPSRAFRRELCGHAGENLTAD
jgi:hypothetical protein